MGYPLVTYKAKRTVSVHSKEKSQTVYLVKDKKLTPSQVKKLTQRQLDEYCEVVEKKVKPQYTIANSLAACFGYRYGMITIQKFLDEGYTEQDILDAFAYSD